MYNNTIIAHTNYLSDINILEQSYDFKTYFIAFVELWLYVNVGTLDNGSEEM